MKWQRMQEVIIVMAYRAGVETGGQQGSGHKGCRLHGVLPLPNVDRGTETVDEAVKRITHLEEGRRMRCDGGRRGYLINKPTSNGDIAY